MIATKFNHSTAPLHQMYTAPGCMALLQLSHGSVVVSMSAGNGSILYIVYGYFAHIFHAVQG